MRPTDIDWFPHLLPPFNFISLLYFLYTRRQKKSKWKSFLDDARFSFIIFLSIKSPHVFISPWLKKNWKLFEKVYDFLKFVLVLPNCWFCIFKNKLKINTKIPSFANFHLWIDLVNNFIRAAKKTVVKWEKFYFD